MTSPRSAAAADRAARICQMFKDGLDDAEIAKALGTCKDTVRSTRSRLGLQLTPEQVRARKVANRKASSAPDDRRTAPAPDVSHLYAGRRYDDPVKGVP